MNSRKVYQISEIESFHFLFFFVTSLASIMTEIDQNFNNYESGQIVNMSDYCFSCTTLYMD